MSTTYMPPRYVAKRPARGHWAQVWDNLKQQWMPGTSEPYFHEVATIAEVFNRAVGNRLEPSETTE